MATSIYVHVPFCLSRCPYCAFYSGERLAWLPEYAAHVAAEIDLRTQKIERIQGPAQTVYFGGGTPSLLDPAGIGRILEAIALRQGLADGAEITLEVNPGITLDLRGFRSAGVTRLSVGLQSLDDAVLAFLGRRHTAEDGLRTLAKAGRTGFEAISADLIFGIPDLASSAFSVWAPALVEAGASHVSPYSLEVHPDTPLSLRQEAGLFTPLRQEEEQQQWQALHEALETVGYRLYEISNYCMPGFECRHNIAYWERQPYLGLGPGAHSFDRLAETSGWRSWNRSNLDAYRAGLQAGRLPPQTGEHVGLEGFLLESLFLGLRRPVPLDFGRLLGLAGGDANSLGVRLQQASAARLISPVPQNGPLCHCATLAGMRTADRLAVWLSDGFSAPTPQNRLD